MDSCTKKSTAKLGLTTEIIAENFNQDVVTAEVTQNELLDKTG